MGQDREGYLLMSEKILFDAVEVQTAVLKLGSDIAAVYQRVPTLIVVGVQSGGMNLARLLKSRLEDSYQGKIVLGSVDTTLYRDDLNRISFSKGLLPMEIPGSVEDTAILLVDDVIFTGRSVRAAMDALFCLGRPASIRLCVLVDRGHRELPIQPDFTGLKVETAYDETVSVQWQGLEGTVKLMQTMGGHQRPQKKEIEE